MYFKRSRLFKAAGCIVVLIVGFCSHQGNAEEAKVEQLQTLKLVPNKCVALRKGRECFATIKIEWQAERSGRYCLRRLSDQLQINCWSAVNAGSFSYVFSSNADEKIELVNSTENRVIAVSKIKVSWVYNSNKRRTRWRVF